MEKRVGTDPPRWPVINEKIFFQQNFLRGHNDYREVGTTMIRLV